MANRAPPKIMSQKQMLQFLLPQKRKFSAVVDIEDTIDDTSASDDRNDDEADGAGINCTEELTAIGGGGDRDEVSWKPKIENLEVSSRRCFEDWFQEQGDVIYERTRLTWLQKVRDFYHQTNGLANLALAATTGPERTSGISDRDAEYIIRHSYQVPVSQDRFRANGGIANYRGKFLWPLVPLGTFEPWSHYVNIVVDRICSTYCASELKQAHEKRQTDDVTEFLQSLGYKAYCPTAPTVTSGSLTGQTPAAARSVLPPPGYFMAQCEIKSSSLARISLKIDVAVTCPCRMGELSSAVLIELKSASDEANTSKRMKEEGERYAKAEQLMGELMKSHHASTSGAVVEPVIGDWKVIIILSGYFTARAMEHFQATKANAACLWFDNGNYREHLRRILSRDHEQNNKYAL